MSKVTRISATELLKKRGSLLRRCFRHKEHFIIETHGMPIAVLVPIDEYELTAVATGKTSHSEKY